MKVPQSWFVEPITVETYAGQNAYGDSYGAPVTILGHVAGGRNTVGGQSVQSGSQGDEVVTNLRLMVPNPARLADGSGVVDPLPLLKPESRVTSGDVRGVVGEVAGHRQPGTGAVVYVSAELR